ncbi:hypothetical protein V494_02412 [Pseudogymnoascus sp. VKM F-4513 (FW-928)]|nr:hypothetical protein V494_02412 [Pseudogymnoascus sp. VKM F-4513 (FW-928)]
MGLGTATMVSSVLGKRSRMRTYANRIRKDTADSPAKRVCTEVVKPLTNITNLLPVEPLPIAKGKKTIADYFAKPPTSATPPSSHINPASDRIQEHIHSSQSSLSETPPSSPPLLEPDNTCVKPPSRKRRRLTTRPRTINQNKMTTPEDYDYDSGTSSDASSWESSVIEEYATDQDASAQRTTRATNPQRTDPEIKRKYRANTFTSSSPKGPKDAGRARYNTRAGGEDMVGEFSDMVYPVPANYSWIILGATQPRAIPPKAPKNFERAPSNTMERRDAEKAFPIPAYSDSFSKTDATPAGSNHGENEIGQKEPTKPAKLVQTQINLGQNPIISCNTCKFTFNRTMAEDVKAHDRFHKAFVSLAKKIDMDDEFIMDDDF